MQKLILPEFEKILERPAFSYYVALVLLESFVLSLECCVEEMGLTVLRKFLRQSVSFL